MLFGCLVSCLLLPTFTFMGLMRRKLTPILTIARMYLPQPNLTLKQLFVKSSRSGRDKKLLDSMRWLRKPVVRLKNKGNFRSACFIPWTSMVVVQEHILWALYAVNSLILCVKTAGEEKARGWAKAGEATGGTFSAYKGKVTNYVFLIKGSC